MLAFRLVVTVHCALILLQALLAGQYLSGVFDALAVHRANAGFVLLAGWAQAVAALVLWRRARGPAWPLGATALVCVAELLQFGAGNARELGLHVPLGVTLFGAMTALTGWAWARR